MIRNYFKIAMRNLLKHKFYSVINILGLAVGVTCFLFIILYVREELSYDLHHEKADRTYRINVDARIGDQNFITATSPAAVGPALLDEMPEVESIARFRDRGKYIVSYEDKKFSETDIIYADSSIFEVFTLPLIQGDPQTALQKPNTTVITASAANKYFGQTNPIGKFLTVSGSQDIDYMVTGVLADLPRTQHFKQQVYLSLSTLDESKDPSWGSFNFQTYIVLREGTDPASIDARFPGLVRKYFGPIIEQFMGASYEEFLASGNYANFDLFPMTDIHLHSDKEGEIGVNSDIKYVYIFSFIAFFILLIACINFMNLTTARSAARAKEVGVRKVVGANRKHLIAQFLSESIIISAFAFVLAFSAVQLLLPYFNDLAGKQLLLSDLLQPWFISLVVLGVFLVGLLAGSYPAMVLSRFIPVKVLKGSIAKGMRDGGFRSTLVVFQFTITTILIVGAITIYRQLDYIQNKKLGYDREKLMVIEDVYTLDIKDAQLLKQRLLNIPEVKSATISSFLPVTTTDNSTAFFAGSTPTASNSSVIHNWGVDHDYIKTMGMEIIQGRDFDLDLATDSLALIMNEAAVRTFNLEDPLNQKMGTFTDNEGGTIVFNVIGVVKNFHFESLREAISPMVMFIDDSHSNITLKIQSEDYQALRSKVEKEWREIAPNQSFAFTFMDQRFDRVYEAEYRIGNIVQIFTFLAVFIACMGLLGLATYTAQQRTKEIGIRKVLGASLKDLFVLLTKDFAKWVLIAFGIGGLVAWYFMRQWLQDFQYATTLNWDVFALTALLLFLISLATISFQSIRVTLVSPSKTLKYE